MNQLPFSRELTAGCGSGRVIRVAQEKAGACIERVPAPWPETAWLKAAAMWLDWRCIVAVPNAGGEGRMTGMRDSCPCRAG